MKSWPIEVYFRDTAMLYNGYLHIKCLQNCFIVPIMRIDTENSNDKRVGEKSTASHLILNRLIFFFCFSFPPG